MEIGKCCFWTWPLPTTTPYHKEKEDTSVKHSACKYEWLCETHRMLILLRFHVTMKDESWATLVIIFLSVFACGLPTFLKSLLIREEVKYKDVSNVIW